MSFFIRMSQVSTWFGTPIANFRSMRLLDPRPEVDQSFLGMDFVMSSFLFSLISLDQDSLLPSAIQQYHQLLMPALQVIDVRSDRSSRVILRLTYVLSL
jgi:hypothetical protein